MGEVTSLGHEVIDDAVEVGLLVGVAFLVVGDTEGTEVLGGLRTVVLVELKDQTAKGLSVARELHEDLRVVHITVVVNGAEGTQGLAILRNFLN